MYIRTKDGVYNTIHLTSKMLEHYKADIIKRSESLEELCDEGVIEVKFGSTGYIAHFNKNIDELKKFLKYLEECQPITKDEILNVYGAIWTSKGLIYVAKMNENGDLELI